MLRWLDTGPGGNKVADLGLASLDLRPLNPSATGCTGAQGDCSLLRLDGFAATGPFPAVLLQRWKKPVPLRHSAARLGWLTRQALGRSVEMGEHSLAIAFESTTAFGLYWAAPFVPESRDCRFPLSPQPRAVAISEAQLLHAESPDGCRRLSEPPCEQALQAF